LLLLLCVPSVLTIVWRHPTQHRYFQRQAYLGRHKRIYYQYRIAPIPLHWPLQILNRPFLLEVPILLAVLAGHLSLVGPRALASNEDDEICQNDERFSYQPGLVCLHWIRRRSNIHFQTELEDDIDYVRTGSIRGDTAILFRALITLMYGKPAERHLASETICGIRFLNIAMDELISAIMIAVGNKTITKLAFVNPDCLNIAAKNPDYAQCLQHADWICADGIGMKIAGKILDRSIRQNVNGTDLFPRLCAALSGTKHSIYLLGAQAGVAEKVAEWISIQYPQVSVAGTHSGYFTSSEEPNLVEDIRKSGADILLVAMGAPRQEQWIQKNLAQTGAIVGIGVGGLFDFYSGRIPRAPIWLREIGGEWIYRLLQEPSRMWKRYLIGNVTFLMRIFLERSTSKSDKRHQK
jgi:N-acetylglucosaminyldiphosphoundecaprenol N-acetyl-beta-D-mannosaminyltransferase